MRSDMKALLKLLGASFLLAIVLVGILLLAAVGALSRDVAVYLALGVFILGALAIGRFFGPALVRRDQEASEPGTPADRGRDAGLRE
jgi:hypothetical protein